MNRLSQLVVLCRFRASFALLFLVSFSCGSDPLSAGQQALTQGNHVEAVAKLRQAVDSRGDEETRALYRKALIAFRDVLRRPNVPMEDCDNALESFSAITGFGADETAVDGEKELYTQAILCAARHRARKKQGEEAARVIVEGIEKLPGFEPGSPVLAKALYEPAIKAAQSGKVVESTALAQVLYSAGQQGQAQVVVDMLVAAGVSTGDIYPVLQDRANRAKTSDSASGLAASFALWHGNPTEAARWYDEIADRSAKDGSARAKALKRYATLRGEEASRLAQSQAQSCAVTSNAVAIAAKLSAVPSLSAAAVKNGILVGWIEGEKAPSQQLKVIRVGLDGRPASPLTIADTMPRAQKVSASDVVSAYTPKNRETSLALIECGGTIEVAARGAPECSWVRATLNEDGSVSTELTPFSSLGETRKMPTEDVWWNVGCSHDRLVHMWLADTQLMRLAWLSAGEPAGDPSNLRIPGFSPWFVSTGADDGATRLFWIDILGEGRSQILGVVIPENGEIPLGEDETNVASTPIVENIDGRVEHLRLDQVGERYALTYLPQQGDINVRWIDQSGRTMGAAAPIVRLRADALDVRFDAAAVSQRLGVAWTEAVTEDYAAIYFQSVGHDGNNPSRPQRLAGLVRPGLSPVVIGSGEAFAVTWGDRASDQGETIRVSMIRCGQ